MLTREQAARAQGAGQSYLVQHSAGSGKSNTIAWLAYRLSNLHADDEKVFDKVVVITDRMVLDQQLQDTIYRIDHTRGVVEKIDESSTQLANALAGEQAQIIITTLQKFPYVMKHVGEAAKEMKDVLGAGAGPAGGGGLFPLMVFFAIEVTSSRPEGRLFEVIDFDVDVDYWELIVDDPTD